MKLNIQNKFNLYLTKKQLRLTGQRQLILSTFLNSEHHLSVEELYLKTRKLDKTLGQATVYRMIKLMCEAGVATRVDFGDGIFRFEPQDESNTHHHLICDKCKRNIEIDDDEINHAFERIANENDFSFNRHKLYIYGLCPDCRKKVK